ncbi:GntR family transcriptional regulator [Streptomyces sp. NBC_01381]|uniref:GntR family transcriptional regulator n=1 Tax=Streptomyces sp. NBC_01381 TaxID=2903845 RepID=UPI00225ACBFC|nr:GntR family transcriptional regulator [Streptomyces sp. NBC_01381]MCX4667995.1 GntR family transcriptional regulator [Streptomyces sp. NBC_01381]
MTEIQRPGALYQQVAAAIREAILSGEFEPGAPLPSEAQLIQRYQVSRPTVRNAVAALRAEGLIEVRHGKGSFVRTDGQPVVTIERRITHARDGKFVMPNGAVWDEAEEPTPYRALSTRANSQLLGIGADEDLFVCDRLLIDPASGTRAMHRTVTPLSVAADIPALGETPPGPPPAAAYEIMTQAGHKLWWSETVRARMPLPDERSTLRLPDATPILHVARVTHGADDRPLLLEELRTGADRAELAYRITADKEPVRRTRA